MIGVFKVVKSEFQFEFPGDLIRCKGQAAFFLQFSVRAGEQIGLANNGRIAILAAVEHIIFRSRAIRRKELGRDNRLVFFANKNTFCTAVFQAEIIIEYDCNRDLFRCFFIFSIKRQQPFAQFGTFLVRLHDFVLNKAAFVFLGQIGYAAYFEVENFLVQFGANGRAVGAGKSNIAQSTGRNHDIAFLHGTVGHRYRYLPTISTDAGGLHFIRGQFSARLIREYLRKVFGQFGSVAQLEIAATSTGGHILKGITMIDCIAQKHRINFIAFFQAIFQCFSSDGFLVRIISVGQNQNNGLPFATIRSALIQHFYRFSQRSTQRRIAFVILHIGISSSLGQFFRQQRTIAVAVPAAILIQVNGFQFGFAARNSVDLFDTGKLVYNGPAAGRLTHIEHDRGSVVPIGFGVVSQRIAVHGTAVVQKNHQIQRAVSRIGQSGTAAQQYGQRHCQQQTETKNFVFHFSKTSFPFFII